MLCVKAHLPTKQNADSQKKTCFKCFTETACFTQTSRKIMFLLRPSLRPQLHALGWPAGLLLSKLSSAAVVSPWMCYKGFLGVTPCLHNSFVLSKSFAALKTTPLQTNPVLHKCPAPRPQLHALAGSAALLLSLDCTEEQGWFTPRPSLRPQLYALVWLNSNSSGRGGRRNTPTAVKFLDISSIRQFFPSKLQKRPTSQQWQ